ncbi:MAG: DEAD/DEAH box helicase, partial [Flavobacteriales bacterium]
MSNFDKLGLSLPLRQTLDELGFESPTPIQKQAIPSLLENDPTDFIGLAQTGTGKTAAFGLPLIELIDIHDKATQALIMSPTRELGQQTAKMLADFLKNSKALNIEVVYGGAAITKQIRALKRPTQIVVATPGRLLDLIKRKAVSLEAVRYVVLDEADEMLNMGFKEDIDKILSNIQEDHATWLFSATMPAGIRKIISGYMRDPQEVSVIKEEKINKDIAHRYVITKAANKTAALTRFLDMQPDMQAIMFCRTRRETQSISEDLHKQGYNVEALHGDLSQSQRDAAMRRFKKHSMQLLIATDVAARGIDVSNLTHVIHHKLPDQLDYYTHRSGRTGRIGKQGISLAFITKNEGKRIAELERKTQIKFNRIEVPGMEELKSARLEKWVGSILGTDVEQRAVELFKEVENRFEGLSKEDILLRLLTSQLRQLTHQEIKTSDLNEARDKRLDKRSDRKVGNAKKSGRTESGD